MDHLLFCVNCGIALRERIRRHRVSTLPGEMINLLSEWLTFELPAFSHICGACHGVILRCIENNSRDRQLGHDSICYGCGRSVAFTRRHEISDDNPLALAASSWHQHNRAATFFCHACYMRANRELARRSSVDSARFENQEVPHGNIPIAPPLPPDPVFGVEENVDTIMLPNYKRCANTSRRCIFDLCTQSAGHLVPTTIKAALLKEHKVYIPRCARVCEEHLHSNEWEQLMENTSLTNTFTATQIESILDFKNEDILLDFEDIDSMPNNICHYWTGRTTQEFMELYNSIPIQSAVRKQSKSALAMLLMKYRTGDSDVRISTLFKIPKSTLQYKMNLVRKCLTDHFVPEHLGVAHISRQQVAERNTIIPNKLFGNPESDITDRWAIVQCDGTYLSVQKSSNYKYQKKTYSLHKYRNLVKPFLVVSCDGHIVDVYGPFAATQTDAEIMNALMSSDGSLNRYFRQNDVFILDRGFRDAISTLEAHGITVYKPETRDEGERQLTTLQANKSRCVTLCRWVVEIVNGRFKRDFRLFRHVFFNMASPHIMEDFRIAAALINKFYKVIENPPNANEIADRALSRLNQPNYLGQFIEENNLNRRRVLFQSIDSSVTQLNHFPRLSMSDLKLISLGPYQVQQARSYYGEHIRDRGTYEVEICPELEFSDEFTVHIGGNHPILLRGRIKSRHTSRREYFTYILYDEQPSNSDQPADTILGYWCNCVAGNRTVGCCAHIMTILWYLGWARHEENIVPPAVFLDDILIELND